MLMQTVWDALAPVTADISFYLAGIHTTTDSKRCTMMVLPKACFGTTEEVFFSNWDFGAYWEKKDNASCKTYTTFNNDFGKNGTNLF
jgi:hypothetical protein